mmetsp:Transcript_10757/g.38205  ORF Transcript_10757/g.38205 Transcript_10757/m.38205 type:complete len:317 (-) Transcript_10757:147-1097(-)
MMAMKSTTFIEFLTNFPWSSATKNLAMISTVKAETQKVSNDFKTPFVPSVSFRRGSVSTTKVTLDTKMSKLMSMDKAKGNLPESGSFKTRSIRLVRLFCFWPRTLPSRLNLLTSWPELACLHQAFHMSLCASMMMPGWICDSTLRSSGVRSVTLPFLLLRCGTTTRRTLFSKKAVRTRSGKWKTAKKDRCRSMRVSNCVQVAIRVLPLNLRNTVNSVPYDSHTRLCGLSGKSETARSKIVFSRILTLDVGSGVPFTASAPPPLEDGLSWPPGLDPSLSSSCEPCCSCSKAEEDFSLRARGWKNIIFSQAALGLTHD